MKIATKKNAFDIAEYLAAHGCVVSVENCGNYYLLTILMVMK